MKFLMNTNKKLLLRPVTFFPHKHIIESSQAQNFLSDPGVKIIWGPLTPCVCIRGVFSSEVLLEFVILPGISFALLEF